MYANWLPKCSKIELGSALGLKMHNGKNWNMEIGVWKMEARSWKMEISTWKMVPRDQYPVRLPPVSGAAAGICQKARGTQGPNILID